MARIKTPEELDLMRESGARLARVLRRVAREVRAGVTPKELDDMAYELIRAEGGAPAFLGYRPNGAQRPYPASVCISLNDAVVHGVPGAKPIQNGDVVKIDLGFVYKRWYSDAAVTVAVGEAPANVRRLISVTEEALRRAISAARAGNTLGDIGYAVQTHVETNGFSVIKSLTGHGIGKKLHEDPLVCNAGDPGAGEKLMAGMVLALEPMVAMGKGEVRQRADDSFATCDGSLAAHFEHTVAITEKGPEVLTGS